MSTVDLGARNKGNSSGLIDNIVLAATPIRFILVRDGTWSGVLPNGIALSDTARYRDTNPDNSGHYFTSDGTWRLYDLTDFSVYDMRQDNLVVVFPQGG